ncbi:hypothetical protein [Nocardia brasiliensis]|uniref:hypothetical protein n=1 Tax=Nocardia brasiliensis TaxID=37326 RepID=UPI00245617B5|nr:hypothetical protein [Nocardia brasiliensis]
MSAASGDTATQLDRWLCSGDVVHRHQNEIAPSVMRLLARWDADTPDKLRLAPVDSRPKVHQSDGTLREIDEDGWVREPDETDTSPVIDVAPISVRDTIAHAQLPFAAPGSRASLEPRRAVRPIGRTGDDRTRKGLSVDVETMSATIELDDHPGVEYSVTIARQPHGGWVLSRVTIESSSGLLTGWDHQPSAQRLVYNVLYGTDMLSAGGGEAPRDEFDWIPEVTRNLLRRNGISTMATLADMTDDQLLEFPGLGSVRVKRLRKGITMWRARCSKQMRDACPSQPVPAEQS